MSFIVTSRKFFKEVVNGPSFASATGVFDTFLKANSITKNQALFEVSLSWNSKAQNGIPFTITGNTITRPNGSFITDGFISGDSIEIVHNSAASTSTRIISSVSDTTIIYDSTALATETAINIEIHGVTDLTGVEFTYNLIENASSFASPNLQDGALMQFRVDGLTTAFKIATFSANPKTGQNGSFECRKIAAGTGRVQQFEFKHTFINFPYFLDAERAQFEGGSNIGILQGEDCLKYAFQFKAGKTSQNPNERKFVIEEETLGNTGGFNENFNGNLPAFNIESIAYTNTAAASVPSLDVLNDTNVEIIVNSPTGIDLDFNHNVVVSFSKLPEDTDISNSKTFEENFVVDSLFTTRNAATVSSTAIEDLLVTAGTPATDKLKINFTVRFNADQQALLNNGDQYILSVEVDDINSQNIYTTQPRTAVNTLTKSSNVTGLFDLKSFGYYRQDMEVGVDPPYTDFKGFNEDIILQEVQFGLDTALNAKIRDLNFRLVAFNTVTENFFEIYSQALNLQNSPLNAGIQQINIVQSMNYNILSGSNFATLYLENEALIGTEQIYKLKIPFRLSYADYLTQPDADGVFFNSLKPLDGLNQQLSNYSGVNDYEIRVFIDANVSNDDFATTTLYRERLPYIQVFDYEENAASMYSGADIKLQTIAGVDLPDQTINRNQDTLVKAVFTLSPALTGSEVFNGVLRLEEFENGGNSKIEETDSIITPKTENLIQPLTGQTKLKITNTATEVILEGRIKKETAENLPSTNYTISSRPFKQFSFISPDAKVTEAAETKETEAAETKITD